MHFNKFYFLKHEKKIKKITFFYKCFQLKIIWRCLEIKVLAKYVEKKLFLKTKRKEKAKSLAVLCGRNRGRGPITENKKTLYSKINSRICLNSAKKIDKTRGNKIKNISENDGTMPAIDVDKF
mgnify:CR=1 FL=1